MSQRLPHDHAEGRSPVMHERVVEFFDRWAADYDREYSRETPAGYALRVRRRKVLELFDQAGGDVLDVGCGPGVMTEDLLARGCRFYGVEPSEEMIAIARSRFKTRNDAQFFRGDAGRLPFAAACFDAVLCMGVFDSLSDGSVALQEMVRVLKPGGTLIVTGANASSPYAWWKNFVYYPAVTVWQRTRVRLGDRTFDVSRIRSVPLRRLHTRRAAERMVASTGSRAVDVVPTNFNIFLSPLDELMPRTALRVTQRMEEGGWRWPEWIAAGWILKAHKL